MSPNSRTSIEANIYAYMTNKCDKTPKERTDRDETLSYRYRIGRNLSTGLAKGTGFVSDGKQTLRLLSYLNSSYIDKIFSVSNSTSKA